MGFITFSAIILLFFTAVFIKEFFVINFDEVFVNNKVNFNFVNIFIENYLLWFTIYAIVTLILYVHEDKNIFL